jgi:hypothetical protein
MVFKHDSMLFLGEDLVGSGDLRQMSEYPIPHGGQLSFLHPEEMEACIPAS